ncbi:HD domain-containing protein [Candidatus Stoquefichus massiliensis]|uniref:HD domain-containing protein n=1 Tax=Candidatus Stoquefichus massiliensis TaxID=1470350 RepID=UPI000485089C|nr:HD domain-containing protein [Candidatus Stoquefichus massiliensis]
MNRYENLKNIFFQNIEEKCHGIYKQKAYFHSLSVSTLCQKLALEKDLDIELAAIIGLFHDYAQFIHHSSFDHAKRSSEMVVPLLDNFNDNERQMIIQAIAHHSDKTRIDDQYSEILKDADVLAQYFAEPDIILKADSQKRLNQYIAR